MTGAHLQLSKDHEELRLIMRRFAAVIERSDALDRMTLLPDRLAFSQLFTRHVLEEEQCIAALPREHLPESALALLTARHADMLTLRLDYSAHINAWKPAAIDGDWQGYVDAVLALQRRLAEIMAREEKDIFPLLRREGIRMSA